MDGQLTVSILGAGAAGFALAADLASNGIATLLYSHPAHLGQAEKVNRRGGRLSTTGVVVCTTDHRVTTDMAEAVAFSATIVLAVPSSGQETILKELALHDLRRHTLIAVPGNLFALVKSAEIPVGNILETNLSPYSCRLDDDGRLIIHGKKRRVFIAALHPQLVRPDVVQAVFPRVELKWCSSVVEVCLSNVNGVFHPLMVLMNAGRIEATAGDFLIYRDGLTPSVANAMEAVDAVRMRIGAAFGLRLDSSVDVSNECYGQDFTNFVDLARHSLPHNRLRAPAQIGGRNLYEDCRDLLVAWRGLAERLGIDASPLTAVIVLVEMATGIECMKTGRTLRKLNLEHLSRAELVERFSPLRGTLGEVPQQKARL